MPYGSGTAPPDTRGSASRQPKPAHPPGLGSCFPNVAAGRFLQGGTATGTGSATFHLLRFRPLGQRSSDYQHYHNVYSNILCRCDNVLYPALSADISGGPSCRQAELCLGGHKHFILLVVIWATWRLIHIIHACWPRPAEPAPSSMPHPAGTAADAAQCKMLQILMLGS